MHLADLKDWRTAGATEWEAALASAPVLPSCAILARSAASLMLTAGDRAEAVTMARKGLEWAGDDATCKWIADELRDVIAEASK